MSRLALSAALALLCPAARAQAPAAAPAPLVRVEPARFDFGRARPGATLRKEFTLRNAGDAPLLLKHVSTSCGCTAALLGKTTLPPGGSTSLTVSLQSGRQPGHLERHVLVSSNDPRTPVLDVKVETTVVAEGK